MSGNIVENGKEYICRFVGESGQHLAVYERTEYEPLIRCQDCRKADKVDEIFFCKMFSAIVEPWRFCAWGERRSESLAEFIEREGRKRDMND